MVPTTHAEKESPRSFANGKAAAAWAGVTGTAPVLRAADAPANPARSIGRCPAIQALRGRKFERIIC
jgi:hypothetical protein